MDLLELEEIGAKELAARKPIRIRVCTAAGCLSSGAHDVRKRLEKAVEQASLGATVQVCAVGCMRLCCEGPLVQLDPERALYERVNSDQAPSIVSGLNGGLRGVRSCKRFSRLGEGQWLRGPGRPGPRSP